ncbi:MAG: D-tyrosyl-tRNA(Tyr) deacylase [Deltaproteobacteria bacterium]|nr:MAG: D-tyrosyl-tRNA(Tyr) deacylase [Deltaproteobacteria bacterium]
MRAVIQRSREASVQADGAEIGSIGGGLVVFLGIKDGDGTDEIKWLAEKIVNLRIFADQQGRMNKSLAEHGGGMLIVSQFTLYGDCRKGRRPGYSAAARPEIAEPLYKQFVDYVRSLGIEVSTGKFQAEMQVKLTNDGPVTLLLDTDKKI